METNQLQRLMADRSCTLLLFVDRSITASLACRSTTVPTWHLSPKLRAPPFIPNWPNRPCQSPTSSAEALFDTPWSLAMVAQICSAPRSALQQRTGKGCRRVPGWRDSGGRRRRRQLPSPSWRHPSAAANLGCRRPLARAACGQGREGALGERVRQRAALREGPVGKCRLSPHLGWAGPPARRLSAVGRAGLRLHGCGLHVAAREA